MVCMRLSYPLFAAPILRALVLATAGMLFLAGCQGEQNASVTAENEAAEPEKQELKATDQTYSGNALQQEAAPEEVSAPFYEATRDVTAPDFTLSTLGGDRFQLAEHRGEVIVLNFWATWCPPCRQEIPDFIELQDELGTQGVLFVGIAVDEQGMEVVRPFAEQYPFNYPVMVDDGSASDQYGPIAGLPTTFIIDRQGKVRRYAPGMITKEALRPILIDLLEEKVS